jgi:hypothetical protein
LPTREVTIYWPWRIYLKNTGSAKHLDCPGYTVIPPLTYNQSQLAPQELWAEIEVRFDIYLEDDGASLYTDLKVVLRNYQWAFLARKMCNHAFSYVSIRYTVLGRFT